jgi:hypothetical protein
MPFIADKFKTFKDYSLASISDIYEVEESPRPKVELRFLDSVVLWNEEGSELRMEALPKLAQISPGYGVGVSDFDNDGIQDIMMATNFFSSQPETGYMDGGLGWFLKGSKDKQFQVSWPNQSGVFIEGDANGLALIDVDNDGDQDSLFAINDQEFRLLINESDSPQVRVMIEGVPGNAAGIGTRFVIQSSTADAQQAYEISAGGSYLAQSSAVPTIATTTLANSSKIKIYWPDGTESMLEQPKVEKGSLILRYPSDTAK